MSCHTPPCSRLIQNPERQVQINTYRWRSCRGVCTKRVLSTAHSSGKKLQFGQGQAKQFLQTFFHVRVSNFTFLIVLLMLNELFLDLLVRLSD